MATKPGWTGRVFEDFAVGDVYEHPLGRTISPADNVWFSCMTMNTNPIHFDAEYAGRTEFKKPLVNSCLTLALVTGQSVDRPHDERASPTCRWDEVRMPNPLFEGDTVYSQSEVLDDARIEIASGGGHRPGENDRRQPARHDGHRVQADVHGVEARTRAAASGRHSQL